MKDSEIEDLLRRYRPIGPPARLRERILPADRTGRIWPWASAAAVLLVSALALHIAAGDEAARVEATLGPSAAVRVADELTNRLGGDVEARALAVLMLVEPNPEEERP